MMDFIQSLKKKKRGRKNTIWKCTTTVCSLTIVISMMCALMPLELIVKAEARCGIEDERKQEESGAISTPDHVIAFDDIVPFDEELQQSEKTEPAAVLKKTVASDEWGMVFDAYCMQHPILSQNELPDVTDSQGWQIFTQEIGMYRNKAEYTPQQNDLVFIDADADQICDNIGIVQNVVAENEISILKENQEGRAVTETFLLQDTSVLGFGVYSIEDEQPQVGEFVVTPEMPKPNQKPGNVDKNADADKDMTASYEERKQHDDPVFEDDRLLTGIEVATKGIANSTLEDGKTYIIYGFSYDDQKYYALGESGQTEEVSYIGNEITVPASKAVKWTYNQEQGTFTNSQGKYLNSGGWYQPMTVSDYPQQFTVQHERGGRIGTTIQEGYNSYQGYFTFNNNKIVLGNEYYYPFSFALTQEDSIVPPTPSVPPTPPVTPESNLKIRKYVDKLGADDQYDLNLTVDGAYAAEGKNKADIIFVVDTTGSMQYAMDGTQNHSNERWNSIVSSTRYLTNLLDSNPSADIQYSMITFYGAEGSTKDAEMAQYWTGNSEDILNKLDEQSKKLGGGTNYEAACQELADGDLAKNFRTDAQRVVVFLSDGEPNMCYGQYGYTVNEPTGVIALEKAKNMLNYIPDIDMFYTIGVGSDILERSKLEDLSSGLKAKGVKTGYAHCNSTKEIKKAFDEIIRSIVKIKYDHVKITDNLSKYAELVEGTKLRIAVTNAEGKQVGFSEGDIGRGASLRLDQTQLNKAADIKLTYDAQAKKLMLIFPEDYILEDGWQYKLTVTIKPTQEAYKEYADKRYPHVGEQNTGTTSSGQEGFYTIALIWIMF